MTTPDGGQAFPVLECSVNNVTGEMFTFQSSPGLTIRDYLAIHADGFDGDARSDEIAQHLGIEEPSSKASVHEWFLWWCKAEALWRYAQADAMLNVR